jgi:hypothetical protein
MRTGESGQVKIAKFSNAALQSSCGQAKDLSMIRAGSHTHDSQIGMD